MKWSITDYNDGFEESIEVEPLIANRFDIHEIAEHVAELFFTQKDGWEWDWPVTVTLWSDSGGELGKRLVEVEWERSFRSYETKEATK